MVEMTERDKIHTATIVSYLPFDINVPLPSMIPANVVVKGIKEEDPLDEFEVTYIPDFTAFVYQLDLKSIRTTVRSEEVASAICNDYIQSSFQADGDEAHPGLKSIPGFHTKEEIKKSFPDELADLLRVHKNWYSRLVTAADDVWRDPNAKGKSQVISDLQRMAAKRLGLNKDWVNVARTDQVKCPACTSYIAEEALVCPVCSTIVNRTEYEKKFGKVANG